jgi:prolyl-tRNA editing enzyme YbaK/EbsC (Cys-tRNA(Pro) deacylase)
MTGLYIFVIPAQAGIQLYLATSSSGKRLFAHRRGAHTVWGFDFDPGAVFPVGHADHADGHVGLEIW